MLEHQTKKIVSVYLEYVDARVLPISALPFAKFKFTAIAHVSGIAITGNSGPGPPNQFEAILISKGTGSSTLANMQAVQPCQPCLQVPRHPVGSIMQLNPCLGSSPTLQRGTT